MNQRMRGSLLIFALALSYSVFANAKNDMSNTSMASSNNCVVLYIDPADEVTNVPLNHSVTVYYKSPKENVCGSPVIIDAITKEEIMTNISHISFEDIEKGTFLNAYTINKEKSNLLPGKKYAIVLKNTVLSSFMTTLNPRDMEGEYLGETPLSISFSPWKSTSDFIAKGLISHPIMTLTNLLVRTKNVKVHEKINEIMKKNLPHLASMQAQYDVKSAQIHYLSSDPFGHKQTLSALVMYPVGNEVDYSTMPVMLYLHSWHNNKNAPSNGNTIDMWMGAIAASQGYIFMAPDMLGHGKLQSQPPADYMLDNIGQQIGSAVNSLSMYMMDQLTSAMSNNLIIVGGQEGAFKAMAGWIWLTKHHLPVKKVIVYSGFFDPTQWIENVSTLSFHQLSHLKKVLKSYTYYLGTQNSENFNLNSPDTKYLLSLIRLNSLAPYIKVADKTNTSFWIYESDSHTSAPEDPSQLIGAILTNTQLTPILKRIPCMNKGLMQLNGAGVLNKTTICSYLAWDGIIENLSPKYKKV